MEKVEKNKINKWYSSLKLLFLGCQISPFSCQEQSHDGWGQSSNCEGKHVCTHTHTQTHTQTHTHTHTQLQDLDSDILKLLNQCQPLPSPGFSDRRY